MWPETAATSPACIWTSQRIPDLPAARLRLPMARHGSALTAARPEAGAGAFWPRGLSESSPGALLRASGCAAPPPASSDWFLQGPEVLEVQCKLIKFPSLESPVQAVASRGMARAGKETSTMVWGRGGECEPAMNPTGAARWARGREGGRGATAERRDALTSPDLGIARGSYMAQAALGARPRGRGSHGGSAPPSSLPSPAKASSAVEKGAPGVRDRRSRRGPPHCGGVHSSPRVLCSPGQLGGSGSASPSGEAGRTHRQ